MRFVPLLSTLLLLTTPHLGSSQTVYDVVPVDLGRGYRIDGGTITVIDTEIVAWNIPVTGELPYTFSHTNPGADFSVTGDGFNISPNEITFPAPRLANNLASFTASDNSNPECNFCNQLLLWSSVGGSLGLPLGTNLRYTHADIFDIINSAQAVSVLPDEEILVALVPEPTSSLLLALGVLTLMGARQKRWRR
jgi:hypothetical protein